MHTPATKKDPKGSSSSWTWLIVIVITIGIVVVVHILQRPVQGAIPDLITDLSKSDVPTSAAWEKWKPHLRNTHNLTRNTHNLTSIEVTPQHFRRRMKMSRQGAITPEDHVAHDADVVPAVPPLVVTQNHLPPIAFQRKVPRAHGMLASVIQWDGYPYEEEVVAGISQTKLPKKIDMKNDEYFQEYVEDHMPILGRSPSYSTMIHVVQHHDPARSFFLPHLGHSLREGSCWGKCAWYRVTYKYAVESVKLQQEDAKFQLYLQAKLSAPIHSCSGANCGYVFGMADRGHWFVAVATPPAGKPEVIRIYVSFPNACGQSGFTQKELTCSSQQYRHGEAAALARLSDLLSGPTQTPHVNFGIEMEGSLRVPYKGAEKAAKFKAVKLYFDGDRDSRGAVYDQVQKMYEKPAAGQNRDAVQACFNNVTAGLFARWQWSSDGGLVEPEYADDPDETWGVPFEINPGNPPNLLGSDGLREMIQVMAALESMGRQANSDQRDDVHLMVRRNDQSQGLWTDREIARFWLGYAKFQYVIDEIQPSSIVQSNWAQGLYAWDPKVQYVFQNLHRLTHGKSPSTVTPLSILCDAILGVGECDEEGEGFWPAKHSPLRYYSVNFAILKRFGSVEMRQHASTTSPENMVRWIDVVLRMGEAFRKDVGLDAFFDQDVETDLKEFHGEQTRVSMSDFFKAVGVPQSSQDYWVHQKWAKTPKGEWLRGCKEHVYAGSHPRRTVDKL